ncbi:MAG: dihydrofolate reductase family protein [Acidimicrobiia bacterium]
MFRTLEPAGDPIDILEMLFSQKRVREDRPWVMFNMVESVDGGTAVDGGASALNDADDRALFLAMRAVADVVLMGAETIRSEGMGPVRMSEEMSRYRAKAGLEGVPRMVILTRSLSLNPEARVFSDPDERPTILTGNEADQDRLDALSEVADVAQIDNLDGNGIVDHLGAAKVILCEGGPTVNSVLMAAGMGDEINITMSPMLALGESKRIAHGEPLQPPINMRLDRVVSGDRSLFLRYIRASADFLGAR